MLLSLNDDCLEYICNILELADQVALASTCERLESVLVERIWKRFDKKLEVDSRTSAYFNENQSVFKHFLCSIAEKVIDLKFMELNMNIWNSLVDLDFPSVLSLQIIENFETSDLNLQVIANAFPNLEKLAVSSPNITGENLWKLTKLKELDLSKCISLKPEYFIHVFTQLKLRTLNLNTRFQSNRGNALVKNLVKCEELEELTISDAFALFINWNLNKLTKLRKIKLYSSGSEILLADVSLVYCRFVERIIFNKTFKGSKQNMFCVLCMENLQSFILHDDTITADQLTKISEHLGENLLEVRFIASLDKKAEGLLVFLEHCTNLEILDISHNPIDDKLLRGVIAALGTRNKPLTIHCFNTKVTTEDLEVIELPNSVEISAEKEDIVLADEPYVKCEWRSMVVD